MHNKLQTIFREPVNALTHLAGVILSFLALILLILRSVESGSLTQLVAFTIFGVSLILLYTSSTLYHSVKVPKEVIHKYRSFDHMMIYVLIAGSFTPFCLLVIGDVLGTVLLIVIWSLALIGIILKLYMGGSAGWLSISIYIAMGWASIAMIPYMVENLPVSGLIWLGVGGVIYTSGAIIYGLGKPDPIPNKFGYHEIWHLFVLGGSFSHFWAVYNFVG